ncbi:methyltransferase [Sciscionella marina]|uniref:methyltransferase n=1 Tax=Sciscionella marina TaxID=508770 RepID=UPI000375E70C|nr:methyltransferase [Sciscionella marina]
MARVPDEPQRDVAANAIADWLRGAKATQLAKVFAELGIAEDIGNRTVALGALAEQYRMRPERLLRLLRGFVELNLLAEPEPERFTLTATGSLLRKGAPGSWREIVLLSAHEVALRSWERLEAGVRGGKGGFHEAYGASIFECLRGDAELAALYDDAMGRMTASIARCVAENYEFTGVGTVADIGGGDGTLIATILRHHPGLRGIVFDRTEDGKRYAPGATFVTGDFFAAVPGGADRYLLKWILHDWADEQAVAILSTIRAAMPEHARLLIIEQVLAEPGAPRDPELTDLNMLMLYGGRERTRAEFEELCTRAGLRIERALPLPGTTCGLLEAVR